MFKHASSIPLACLKQLQACCTFCSKRMCKCNSCNRCRVNNTFRAFFLFFAILLLTYDEEMIFCGMLEACHNMFRHAWSMLEQVAQKYRYMTLNANHVVDVTYVDPCVPKYGSNKSLQKIFFLKRPQACLKHTWSMLAWRQPRTCSRMLQACL